jgi:hypothetical protein
MLYMKTLVNCLKLYVK